jgi:hypothetical protein
MKSKTNLERTEMMKPLNEAKRQLDRVLASVEKRPFNQIHQALCQIQYVTFKIQEILKQNNNDF